MENLELTKKELEAIAQAICHKFSFDIDYQLENKDRYSEGYSVYKKLVNLGIKFE